MLTLTLRGPQRVGLVKRAAFATIPPRVDDELTDLETAREQYDRGSDPVSTLVPT